MSTLLLWGESVFLLRLAAAAALGDVRPVEIDAADWRPGATADLATPSLFGEARALLVTSAQALPEEGLAEVAAYAADPAPDATLVLLATVGDRAKAPPAALKRALAKIAEIRQVAVERKELERWVLERAKGREMDASPKAAKDLVEILGEDPAVLDQAVAQIADAFPQEGLTPENVATQFRGFGDRKIWELCDAAFARNLPQATRVLTGMLRAREEPLAILGGIAARLRDLIRVRGLPERMPPAELARAAGLRFDWQARRYREQAARFTPEELAELHTRLVDADRTLKLGAQGDVVLPMVVSRIAAARG